MLGQTYPRVELIVGGDGSTDGASEILPCLADAHPERLTLVFENCTGPFAVRNGALARANGNFIAFLDADDTWHPDALRQMHAALEAEHADVVGIQASCRPGCLESTLTHPTGRRASRRIFHCFQ